MGKLDPQWLEHARQDNGSGAQKVSDQQLADYLASGNDENSKQFSSQLKMMRQKGSVRTQDGQEISPETAVLNFWAYGTTKGSGKPAPTKQLKLSDVIDNAPPSAPFVADVGAALDKRGDQFAASVGRFKRGEQTLPETVFQLGGQGAGFATADVPGAAMKAVSDSVQENPGMIGPVMGAAKKATIDPLADSIKKNPGFLGPLLQQAGLGIDKFKEWAGMHPRAAANLEAAFNIATAIPAEKIAGGAAKEAGPALEGMAGAGKDALAKGADAVAGLADNAGQAVSKTLALPGEAIDAAKLKLAKKNAAWASVPNEVVDMAYTRPQEMQKAIEDVLKNPDNPYGGLARETGNRLLKLEEGAKENFKTAKKAFKAADPEARFDVSQSVESMNKALSDEFNTTIQPKEAGGRVKVALVQSEAEPLPQKEIGHIEDLVNKIANAKSYTPDSLLDLEARFDRAYNAVPLTADKTPTRYHAMVMTLKDAFDKAMFGTPAIGNIPGTAGILPDEMVQAYRDLAEAKKMVRNWGSKLLEGAGAERRVSQNAESFVKSITNVNRDVRRQYLRELERALGMDITDKADLIDAAKVLSKLEASTAGRQGDVMKALTVNAITRTIGGGLGVAAGGLTGSPVIGGLLGYEGGGVAAKLLNNEISSPYKAGQRLIKAGLKAASKAK